MHGALHPKSDTSRLYPDRKDGSRGLKSVQQTVKEEQSIKAYAASMAISDKLLAEFQSAALTTDLRPDEEKQVSIKVSSRSYCCAGTAQLKDMAEASTELVGDYKCGFCCIEFKRMVDPRTLPCQHVYCKKCLEEHAEENDGKILCEDCDTKYEKPDIEKFPKVRTKVTAFTAWTCDCHNCTGKQATCYCLQCARRMCDTHKQGHSDFFGDSHTVIPISTYAATPGKYKIVRCRAHGDEVIACCRDCAKHLCQKCDLDKKECSGGKKNHNISLIPEIRDEMKTHFQGLLNSANDKITKFCKADKDAWRNLDKEEQEWKAMKKTTEDLRKKMIMAVNAECKKIHERIDAYQRKRTTEVEAYDAEVMSQIGQLKMTVEKIHSWLKESDVTEQQKRKEKITEKLKRQFSKEIPHLQQTSQPFITSVAKIVRAATSGTKQDTPAVVVGDATVDLPFSAHTLLLVSNKHEDKSSDAASEVQSSPSNRKNELKNNTIWPPNFEQDFEIPTKATIYKDEQRGIEIPINYYDSPHRSAMPRGSGGFSRCKHCGNLAMTADVSGLCRVCRVDPQAALRQSVPNRQSSYNRIPTNQPVQMYKHVKSLQLSPCRRTGCQGIACSNNGLCIRCMETEQRPKVESSKNSRYESLY
ncbi:uncharacterized protein [Watersipora subatra]|uniref:uncharacterized protein n=1 Tax=Watersipora subatra TaxID=2589382 RepID=UPI00355C6FC7